MDSRPLVSISMQDLMGLAQRMLKQMDAVKASEDALKIEKERLALLQNVQMPNAMRELYMDQFRLADGRIVEIRPTISCSVSDENMEAAREFLTLHNHHGIIKHLVITEFGKGEDALAQKIIARLKEALLDAASEEEDGDLAAYMEKVKDVESINYQTLAATIRKLMGDGIDVPEEPFALWITDVVKVKVPK